MYKEFHELREIALQSSSREWIGFYIPNAGIALLKTTTGWYETIVLGLFCPADEVGVFFIALRTAHLANIVLVATNAILTPLISERWSAGQIDSLQQVYKTTTRWCFIISVPIVISMLISRSEVMLLFGAEFSGGSIILALLLLGRLMNSATGGVAQILVMTGSQRLELINVLIHALLITVGTYLSVRYYGIVGAAIVNSFVVSSMNIVKLLQVWKRLHIHPIDTSYVKALIGAMMITLLGYSIHSHFKLMPATALLLVTVASVVLGYAMILFVLGFSTEDKYIFQSAKNKIQILIATH